MQDAGVQRAGWWATLGWAAYLACSWTWCIGMFLPVLLVRDFGVWGFVVFAVPNVVGAGAMGWVLRNPDISRRIVERHWWAAWSFSTVTVAFQVFALVVFMPVIGQGFRWVFGPIIVLCLIWWPASQHVRWAVVLLCTSLIAFAGWLLSDVDGLPSSDPHFSAGALLWLAPVTIFGFGLCPYLDLTFHRARMALPGRTAAAAFSIGFVVFFVPMILFTLFYSGWAVVAPADRHLATGWPFLLLGFHVLTQLGFTSIVHVNEASRARRQPAYMLAATAIALILVLNLIATATNDDTAEPLLSETEVTYRMFMAFYGLVFPAYVWLLMIPTRDGHSGLGGTSGRRKLLIWCFAVGVAAPMFWMGFIERQTWWLGPGLGVVLAARAALPRGQRSPERE